MEVIEQIRREFQTNARSFIEEVYKLEGKPLPALNSEKQVAQVWGETQRRITQELMMHNNEPVPDIRLKELAALQSLPKSIRLIIESIQS